MVYPIMAAPETLQICRTCVLKAPSLASIFGEKGGLGFSIADLIYELLDLKVCPGDGLPDKICCNCLNELARFKRFKNICHEAKVTLEYIIKKDKADVIPQVLLDAKSTEDKAHSDRVIEVVSLDDSSEDEGSSAETVCAPSPPPISISSDDDSFDGGSKEMFEDGDAAVMPEPSTSFGAVKKVVYSPDVCHMQVSKDIASDIDEKSRNVTTLATEEGDHTSKHSSGDRRFPECSTGQLESKNHTEEDELLICHFCRQCVSSPSTYRDHLRKCFKEPFFHTCEVCRKSFNDVTSLRNHRVTHSSRRPKDDRKKIKLCDVVKPHKMDRTFKCGVCKIAFKKISSLKKHLRSHKPMTECICGECDETFKNTKELCRHIVLNHNRGFFKCPTCSERFLDIYSLKRHSNEFCPGIRPFECLMCQNSFKTQNSLDVHISESH